MAKTTRNGTATATELSRRTGVRESNRMLRQIALERAIAVAPFKDAGAIIGMARKFYDFLRGSKE